MYLGCGPHSSGFRAPRTAVHGKACSVTNDQSSLPSFPVRRGLHGSHVYGTGVPKSLACLWQTSSVSARALLKFGHVWWSPADLHHARQTHKHKTHTLSLTHSLISLRWKEHLSYLGLAWLIVQGIGLVSSHKTLRNPNQTQSK